MERIKSLNLPSPHSGRIYLIDAVQQRRLRSSKKLFPLLGGCSVPVWIMVFNAGCICLCLAECVCMHSCVSSPH